MAGRSLVTQFNTPARQAARIGKEILVPRLFDSHGKPLPKEKIGARHLLRFNLKQAQFLQELKETGGDLAASCGKCGVTEDWAKRFLRRTKTRYYLQEHQFEAQLAKVATPDWLKAVYAEAALGKADPTDTQKWGIDRLKEIVIPKQAANINIQNNVFSLPKLSRDEEVRLKILADEMADTPNA